MHHRIVLSIIALGVGGLLFSLYSQVFAADLKTYELQIPIGATKTIEVCTGSGDTLQCGGVATYIVAIYEFLIRAAAIFAVMMIVLGGVQWLTAAGESKRVQQAQKFMRDAIAGLVLILCSQVLLKAINPDLVNLKNFDLAIIKAKQLPEMKTATRGACCYTFPDGTESAQEVPSQAACESAIISALFSQPANTNPKTASFCPYVPGFNSNTIQTTNPIASRFAPVTVNQNAAQVICDKIANNTNVSNICSDTVNLASLTASGLPGTATQVKSYIQSNKIKFTPVPGGGTTQAHSRGTWARGLGIQPVDMNVTGADANKPLEGENPVDQRIIGAILSAADCGSSATISALNEPLSTVPKAHPSETSPNKGHAGGKAVDLTGQICDGTVSSAAAWTCTQKQTQLVQNLQGRGYTVCINGKRCGATCDENNDGHFHIQVQ